MCRNDWLNKYCDLTLQKKSIEDGPKELKRKIVEGLPDYGKYKKDGFEVNYLLITSNRFDIATFKEEMPVFYEQYQKTSESERLTVKPIK